MKKIILAAAILSIASYANSAVLISGWSFASTLTSDTTHASDFSDVTGDGTGNANATIYADGTNGSSNFQQSAFPGGSQSIAPSNVNQNADITTRLGPPQLTQSPASSLTFIDDVLFGNPRDANGLSFVIAINPLIGMVYQDVQVTYGAALQNADSVTGSDITWEISFTGFDSGFGQTVTNTVTNQVADGGQLFSEAFTGSGSQFWLKATLGGANDVITGNPLMFDNLQVLGTTAVPEPSTYAAIAGVLVLGVVALRRRRK